MVKNISLSTDERRAFNYYYGQADREQLGVLTGDKAIVFFEGTQLPGAVLGEIWQMSDDEDTGFLTKEAFYVACRLIGHAQAGKPPTADLIDKQGPIPWFKGLTVPGLSRQPAPPSQTAVASLSPTRPVPGTPSRQTSVLPAAVSASPTPSRAGSSVLPSVSGSPLSITAEDKAKYQRLFYNTGPVAGLLDADKASEILKKSRLPDIKLGQIWNLADTKQRGALDAADFVIAMALIQASMSGSLQSIPDELPDSIYLQAGTTKPGAGYPSVPTSPIRQQMTGPGLYARSPAPLSQQNTGSFITPGRAAPSSLSQSTFGSQPWFITPLEKSQSDTFFAMLDTARAGFVSGDIAGPFFMQSGLSGDILAAIWDLSDIKNEGRLDKDEFALARRLVMDALAGKPVPERLDEAMVPPALRPAWRAGVGADHQPQQSEIQKDLFSLMDDDEPASSLPAPALAAGASAFAPQSQGGPRVASPAPLQATATGNTSRSVSFATNPLPATFSESQTPVKHTPPPVPPHRTSSTSLSHGAALGPGPARATDLFVATPDEEKETVPQIHDRSAELGNLQNQVSSTQRSVTTLRDQRTKLADDVNKIEAQISELEVSLSQAKAAYDVESTNMTNLEARQKSGQEALTTLKQQTITAESDLSALREQKAELEQAILRDKEEVRDLRSKLKASNDEASALKEELERLKKEARQQKGMVVVNKKQLATSEAEIEGLRKSIAAERENATAVTSEPASMLAAGLSRSDAVSPAASTTSTRSKNPFDRAGTLAAGAVAGGVAGLAIPAAMHAHQGQEQGESSTRGAEATKDPFGLPQQSTTGLTSDGFGFDDDFGASFTAPGAPGSSQERSSQQMSSVVGALRSTQASAPITDFDSAFAEFDKPAEPAENQERLTDVPKVAPEFSATMRSTSPAPESAQAGTLSRDGQAAAAAASSSTADVALPTSQGARTTSAQDTEVENETYPGQTAASLSEHSQRGVTDDDGDEDLPPIQEVVRPDSPDSESEDEETSKTLHSSSQPVNLVQPGSDIAQTSSTDATAGSDALQTPAYPGAYPVSTASSVAGDDGDAFEDAHANLPENGHPPSTEARHAPAEADARSATLPTDPRPDQESAKASTSISAMPSAPDAPHFDTDGSRSAAQDPFGEQPFTNERTQSAGLGAHGSAEAEGVSTHSEKPLTPIADSPVKSPSTAAVSTTEASSAPQAPRDNAGKLSESSTNHSKDSSNDFDDFEDLAPAHIETKPADRDFPISTASFDDNFDEDFGFDKQTFSHTMPQAGVGQVSEPQGRVPFDPSASHLQGRAPTSFDDAFDDAFTVPPAPSRAARQDGIPASSGGFDDDFFSGQGQQAPSSTSTSVTAAHETSHVPMFAPPAGPPPTARGPTGSSPSTVAPTLPSRPAQSGQSDLPEVTELLAMGFDRKQAMQALEDNQFDLGRAANALLAVNQ